MAEFKINLNDIYSYDWGSLYWFEYEVTIGFWALKDLIIYQEEIYVKKQNEFISKRDKVLPTVPDEYRDSYEQHFFEDADRTFGELKYIQRNSVCLSFFSYFEGKLLELVRMMEVEFNVPYKRANMEILMSINRYIVNDCKIDATTFRDRFKSIVKQSPTRNAIAHNQSLFENVIRFKKEEGIILKGKKAIIEDVIYLNNLINWAEDYFEKLFVAIDKRLKKINSVKK